MHLWIIIGLNRRGWRCPCGLGGLGIFPVFPRTCCLVKKCCTIYRFSLRSEVKKVRLRPVIKRFLARFYVKIVLAIDSCFSWILPTFSVSTAISIVFLCRYWMTIYWYPIAFLITFLTKFSIVFLIYLFAKSIPISVYFD